MLQDLGEEALTNYKEAVSLCSRGDESEDAECLKKSTEIFVNALTAVPEDKTKSAGYAELLLAYGKTLLAFLRRTTTEENILGGDVEAELPKGKAVEREAEEEDIEEDVDTEVLTWEQLEHARLTFEALGDRYTKRLADVFEALGDLLVESDQSEAAAAEYTKAVTILRTSDPPQHRIVAHLLYRKYLALRRDAPQAAISALQEGVHIFESVVKNSDQDSDKDVLDDMQEELKLFKEALAPALAKLNETQTANNAKPTEANGTSDAIVVQPRRRTQKDTPSDQTQTHKEQPPTKKTRVD